MWCRCLRYRQTRLQVKRNASDWGNQELFRGLYEGILPPLLIGAPSGENPMTKSVFLYSDEAIVLDVT